MVGLPLLEAMLPSKAYGAPLPLRFACLYFSNGSYAGSKIGGRPMGAWYPAATGSIAGIDLPVALQPLMANRGDFSIISGLTHSAANGAGHSGAIASFLVGQKFGNDGKGPLSIADSMDQVLANDLVVNQGYKPVSRSLVMSANLGQTRFVEDRNPIYMNHISYWQNRQVDRWVNPRALFNSLFTSAPPPADKADAQSVLDFVKADTERLKKKLGTEDKHRLDEYLTKFREIEARVNSTGGGTCTAGSPPTINSETEGTANADHGERIRNFIDILVLAFRCDSSRIATLLLETESFGRFYSAVPGFSETLYMNPPLNENSHVGTAHHEENMTKIQRLMSINRYQVGFFKLLLDKLKATPELNGKTLLDSSIILYGCGLSDGQAHSKTNLPLLLGGRGGGIQSGQHLKFQGKELRALQLSIIRKFMPMTSWRGISDPLPIG